MMDQVADSVESQSDGPWELPEVWEWTTIGGITLVIAGQSPPSDTYNDSKDGLPFFQGKAEFGPRHPTVRKWCASPTKIAEAGDILISVRAPVGPTNVADVRCGIGRGLAAIRSGNTSDTQWVLHWLRFSEQQLASKGTGTTFAAITGDVLREHPIPLAPLAEQRRIVARVDALFAEIAEGEAALDAARKGLDTFRRALLKAAVTGKLTKGWRENNPVAETGHDLLARIAKSRAAKGQTNGRGKRAADAAPLDISALPALPAGWAWGTVDEVGSVQLGRQRAPQHHTGENMRPYVRVANVFEDRIDISNVKEMNFTHEEFRTFQLFEGDVLLNEGQTPDLLGRPAIWRNQVEDCCFQNTLIRFRAFDGIAPEWALLVFRAYLHIKRFKRESQITTNIAHLSAGRFAKIEFPIPPPAEAAEILRRVSEALAASADTLAVLDAEAADAARLKQSILKAAFEGRLVPQDPADEPASGMLARLRATQSTATSANHGRRTKS